MASDFWDGVMRLAERRRRGFRSLCGAIDLLGMRRMLLKKPHEAASRLNDLQKLPEALMFFPGGEKYRACFVGDSWFIVREVSPEEDWTRLWPHFCGHIFALASFVRALERGLGNPGLRGVTAYGEVSQVFEPDSAIHPELTSQIKHWFALTGADQALVKCDEALRRGHAQGFLHNMFWHESREHEYEFLGTPLQPVPPSEYDTPGLYALLFERMVASPSAKARLETKD